MAQPVVLNSTVFTMDSDAVVSAFALADGKRLWRFDTKPEDVDSTNVGGGLGADGSTLYAVNGLVAAGRAGYGQRQGEMAQGYRRARPGPHRPSPTAGFS